MPGELKGNLVVLNKEKEANRIYNKGYPGRPQSGGGLFLGLVEAAFIMDERGFRIKDIGEVVELFNHARKYTNNFEVEYIVYRELKLRGFNVRIPDRHFNNPNSEFRKEIYRLPPRSSPPSAPVKFHVLPISEREPTTIPDLVSLAGTAQKKGVELMAGLVDEDGDVTFYSVNITNPKGDNKLVCEEQISGIISHNRVIAPLDKVAGNLNKKSFFGRAMGTMLHLSILEARYLFEKGIIRLEGFGEDGKKDFSGINRLLPDEIIQDLKHRYPAYRYLRERGLRVKTGFKYGTHFRVYTKHQDSSHAEYLVHMYEEGAKVGWQEISRGVRIAHGVNKRILFSTPELSWEGIFLELSWVRP